jgi:hypothetical protein
MYFWSIENLGRCELTLFTGRSIRRLSNVYIWRLIRTLIERREVSCLFWVVSLAFLSFFHRLANQGSVRIFVEHHRPIVAHLVLITVQLIRSYSILAICCFFLKNFPFMTIRHQHRIVHTLPSLRLMIKYAISIGELLFLLQRLSLWVGHIVINIDVLTPFFDELIIDSPIWNIHLWLKHILHYFLLVTHV